MLGADVRRVERMAQRGEIPCQKIGGQFRFNRAQITEWLQQQMGGMSHDHLAQVDAGMTEQRQTPQDEAIITPMLRPEAVTTQPGLPHEGQHPAGAGVPGCADRPGCG